MMPLSSNNQDAQRERRALRAEAVDPQRHTTEKPMVLGQPRATGLPLNQLLTGSTEQLRDRITNYDDPVHRLIDQPHLILRLLVTVSYPDIGLFSGNISHGVESGLVIRGPR